MAKKSSNDSLIIELKKQVEEKQKALDSSKRFQPKTNCSLCLPFPFNSERVNLNVADKPKLQELAVGLNLLKMSYDSLGEAVSDYSPGGYKLQDWVDDVNARLFILNRSQEEARLKALKDKLHGLLSIDKKVELEIAQLKEMI